MRQTHVENTLLCRLMTSRSGSLEEDQGWRRGRAAKNFHASTPVCNRTESLQLRDGIGASLGLLLISRRHMTTLTDSASLRLPATDFSHRLLRPSTRLKVVNEHTMTPTEVPARGIVPLR